MSLQTVGESVVQWAAFAAMLLVPGLVVTVLWSPFLLSERVRALFDRLPPFESPYPNYVLFALAGSLPYVAGLLWAFRAADTGSVVFTSTLVVSVVYVVALPIGAVLGLPRAGVDWDPTGYGVATWGVLVAGAVWYALLFAAPLTVVSIVYSLP